MSPDDVTDFDSFTGFVSWLASDHAEEVAKERLAPSSSLGPGTNGWENSTIEAFLEAAAPCPIDTRNKAGQSQELTWREFAQFLLGRKVYE